MNKRGLSDIITTILIILIALAAIVLIWAFIRNDLLNAGGQVDASVFTTKLSIPTTSVKLNETSQQVSLVVKREEGIGALSSFTIVLEDVNGNKVPFSFNFTSDKLEELETGYRSINYTGTGLSKLAKITVIPYVLNKDGKVLQGKNEAVYEISGSESNTVSVGPAINLNSGLVEYLSFNNPGSVGHDDSGNGNNWINGGASFVSCTASGQGALSFNGINNEFNVSDSNILDINGSVTLSAWIKINSISPPGNKVIIWKGDEIGTDGSSPYSMGYDSVSQKIIASVGNGPGSVNYIYSASIISPNVWHNIIFSANGTTETIYIDGNKDNSTAQTVNPYKNNKPIYIGYLTTNNAFDGKIDEVRIYNRSLSQNEINALNSSSQRCDVKIDLTSNLVAHWRMNESSGTQTFDVTPNNNTGNFVGNPSWVSCSQSGESALGFNGGSHVDFGSSPSLDFGGTNQITVSMWGYVTSSLGDNNKAVAKDNTFELQIGANWGPGAVDVMRFEVNREGLSWNGGGAVSGSGVTTHNAWAHYVGTWDGQNVRIYKNGTLLATTPQTGTFSSSGDSSNLCIGAGFCGGSDYHGNVDDVRIYKRALLPEEVSALYNLNEHCAQ